jgi:aldose 1-epimerase
MSRYETATATVGGHKAVRLIDTERRAEAVFYPALGNNCTEFRTTPDGEGASIEPIDLFVGPESPQELTTGSPIRFGLPILFPFPNRVRDGRFTFEGKSCFMDKLLAKGWDGGAGQAIHGLVADQPWKLEQLSAGEHGAFGTCALELDSVPDIFEQYPFPCRLQVTYRLLDGVLHLEAEVHNHGDGDLPMGFGIHPWFPVALDPGARLPAAVAGHTKAQRATAEVHVPTDSLWELDHLMPTGRVTPLSGWEDLRTFKPLEDHFFDTVFTGVIKGADGWSEGGLRDPVSGLEWYQAADDAFREWVLYAPRERSVVALEPYTCTTDAVNLEPKGIDAGLISLPAGHVWHGHIRFGLRRSP